MSLKPEEISKLIKDQIRRYDEDLEIDETGTIITVGDGIALIYGLQNAIPWRCLWYGTEPGGGARRCCSDGG